MNVITVLKNIGCEVVSCETTARAMKWWLTYPPAVNTLNARQKVLAALGITTDVFPQYEYQMSGVELTFQTKAEDDHHGILISKPKKTRASHEYAHGIDC